MSKFILTNQKIFFGAIAITPDLSSIQLEYSAEAKDASVFGLGTKQNIGGLKSAQLQVGGYVDLTNSDLALYTAVGVNGTPISLVADTSAVGQTAYFFNALVGEYSPISGSVGDVAGFSLAAMTRSPLIKGVVLHDGVESITGTSAQVVVSAVSATQKMYACLHIISGTGTLDILVESDTTGFATPTTVLTFAQQVAPGSVYITPVSGPITDTFFRAKHTITGGPFNYALFFGVL